MGGWGRWEEPDWWLWISYPSPILLRPVDTLFRIEVWWMVLQMAFAI